ncbi:MAG: YigZ family protein [Crocinitomicaceae bacterium]
MKNTSSYKSIGEINSFEIKEKGSKFIGFAANCKTEEEIKIQLGIWREQHPQATHLCYAFRLGINGENYRANDDGEPSNSAGTPILGQIISADLTNVLVGVVRYYGGTKLGVGGLVSAYKETAKEVLASAKIVEYHLKNYYEVVMTYEDMPFVLAILKRHRFEIISNEMTHNCRLIVQMDLDAKDDLFELLSRYQKIEIKFLEKK